MFVHSAGISRWLRSFRFVFSVFVFVFLVFQHLWGSAIVFAAPAERPLANIPPSVSLNVPAEDFIGQNVNFTVTFDNPDTVPGYGPLIDLVIPANGADGAPTPDGLTFLSATYLGVSVENTQITVPGSGCVTHPYMVDATGAYIQICGLTPGDMFVALRLPFGSFTPDQPPLNVDVAVSMSNLADLGTPLTIQARGGYQFGYTPLDDWCCGDDPSLSLSGWTSDSVTPILFTLEKNYSGPEDETATGPNFPRRYTVTAVIAPGQTMSPFNLTDVLPNNMQFISVISTNPGGATCSHSNPAIPGGTLSCDFASVSGTVSMTFEYYIPLRDSGGASVLDPASGDDATSCNNASGGGTWTPLDPRDTGGTFTQDPTGCEHTLTDKSIAIQKNVNVVGGGDPAPGKYLEYTLDFQVSDFFAFSDIVITDVISDGQHFDSTSTPTLQINGNSYTLSAAAFDAANYDVACHYTGGGLECETNTTPFDGTTTLVFRVSDEIITRGQNGKLIGGCVPPTGTGGGDPSCSSYDDGPTTGRIVFRTLIQQNFTDTYPSGDSSVDQGDTLANNVSIDGLVLSTADVSTVTGLESDDSAASSAIGRGTLSKSIYAINGSTSFSTPVEVKPGDTVTYRLTYTLPTGDVENLAFDDYLPLPVFHVGDADEDGTPGPAWTFDPTVSATVPAAGVAKFGPSDTFYAYSSITPTVASDTGNNRLDFIYGDFDGTVEQQYIVDILFTVTVSDEPFADRLYLTNQAHAFEGSTNAGQAETNAIVQIILTEPVLTTVKSVVASDRLGAVFTPSLPVTFTAPGSPGPRWSGVINSNLLASTPIDSDISGVDAGDLVTFAIFIENSGSSINGAFDIVIQDVFDALAFEYPTIGDPSSINLQIYYGNGTGPISYTKPDDTAATPADLFGGGVKLVDPVGQGVCSSHDPNSGNNVIVITYDLRLKSNIAPGVYTNTGTLSNYSGSEGGPNFLPAPLSDDATVTVVAPATAKVLVSTEINDTANGSDQVVIGEFATYTVTLTIPEGVTPNAQLVDTLDAGLAFVALDTVTASPTISISGSTTPTVAPGGQTITFNFGNITNTDLDNTTAETIALTYRVVVLNVVGNQSGTLLNNSAQFTWDGGSASASATNITVIEPVITTAKSVAPSTADAGDTVTFTVTLSNPASGSTTAYDVSWSDVVPTGLTYVSGTLALGTCTASTPLTLSDASAPTLTGSGGVLQPGESCAITFDASVDYSAAPGQVITNTAQTQWTSLSGAVSDRSSYNTDSDERTGADGVGGALNDYASQGQASVTINNVTPQKYLYATSEAHTGIVNSTQRVGIGEIVRYRLVVQLPEGSSVNFQIDDNLPGGLVYLDDGTAKAAFVANGTGITSSDVGTLPVPGISDADCFLSGNVADDSTPAIPAACSALADNNVGSTNSTSTDVDSYASGTDPQFKLGTLNNNDNDADAEYVILEFNALVANSSAAGNDAGDNRTNDFRVLINGTQNGSLSNSITVRVAEPLLTVVKAVTTAPTDAGDSITYTLTISAASGTDRATAFDLNLTDTFDTNLTGLAVSSVTTTQGATCVGNGAGTTAFSHNGGIFTGSTLTFTATCLDPGQTITVTITGTVADSAPVGYTIPNTANLTWTSLPGSNGTISNPTGSSTPGASGTDTGERDGSDGAGGTVDDYAAASSANTSLAVPQVDKLDPSPAQYAIGEQVTFNILVTLPEGLTPALQVIDDLPLGLEYVSHQIITTAAASGGLLAADYNGTLSNPSVTAPGGSGGDLTLDFGDTTTTGDNATNNNAFLVRVVAVVLNEAANQDGATLTNTATVSWTGGSVNDSVNISIIEPVLAVDKIISIPPSPPDAGGTVTYQVTIQHDAASTAAAYDVNFTDTLPAELTLNLASVSVTLNGGAAGAADNSAGNSVDVTIASIPLGGSVVITYSATINGGVTPGQAITNTGDLTWTSTPGANANERDGNDGPGGALNDYAATDSTTFNVNDSAYNKALEAASAAHTSGNALAIGEVATFGLYVTLPEGAVPSLTIVDDLPAGMEYVSGSAQVVTTVAGCGSLTTDFNGSIPAPTITAPGGSGGDVTFQFVNITVAADNDASNNTFVICLDAVLLNEAGNQNGGGLTNNVSFQIGTGPLTTDSTDVTIVEPELEILKAVSNSTPGVGQTFTYTLTVQHVGTSTADAFDLVISDPLPANLNRVAGPTISDAPSGCAGTVTDNTAGDTISLEVASLPLACVLTITYDAQVDAAASPGDSLVNTATLTWTSLNGVDIHERDGGGGVDDYTDSASQTVTYTAVDLQLTKDDGGITTTAGGLVIYTITYANVGNSDASGVVITETVPANTTFNAASSTSGWSCADGSPAGTTCTFNIGNLLSGANGTLDFAVNVNNPLPAGVTQIENTASITDDGTQGVDAHPSDNIDDDTTPVDAAPDLTIVKDDGLTVVSPGQTITYTLTISNVGTQNATGVVITDTLPADTTFVSASDGGTESGGVVTWPTINLAAGASVTRTVTIQVNDPFPGTSILNRAHVEDDGSNGTDPTPINNDDDDTDSVLSAFNKSLIATNQGFTSDPAVAIGEILTYEIAFTVPAGGTMPNLTVTDILDRGLAFVDCVSITPSDPAITTTLAGGFADACVAGANPTVQTEPSGSANPADPGRRVTFELDTVSNAGISDGTITIRYTAVVLDSLENQDGLSLNNSVVLAWDSGSLSTSAPNVTIVEPDFELLKEADVTVALPGSVITFTLTFRHTSQSNVDAFDVVLTDVLPSGLTYVPGSLRIVSGPAGGVTDDTAAPTLTVTWPTFPLLTGAQRTEAVVEFQAELGNLLPGQEVRNTAALAWTSLPGNVQNPQSPFNPLSTERFYDPGSAVNIYGVFSSVVIRVPRLPSTGFAPGVVTNIPPQPADKAYTDLGDFWLEIPKLGIQIPIVGIPAKGEEWDLTWLWGQAGWLEGTAYPTHSGNAALTAHVNLPNGEQGPFFNLINLRWGDQIIIHLGGQRYIYEVRQVRQVSPYTLSVLKHQDTPYLTLITCRDYDETYDTYRTRVVVEAVLISVEP